MATHFSYSSPGWNRAAVFQSQQTPFFSRQSSDNDLTPSKGMKWRQNEANELYDGRGWREGVAVPREFAALRPGMPSVVEQQQLSNRA